MNKQRANDFDEMDNIMSQMDDSIFEDGSNPIENNASLSGTVPKVEVASIDCSDKLIEMNVQSLNNLDEMDIIMSQIDDDFFEDANAYDENVVLIESVADMEVASTSDPGKLDEMDIIMSQMVDDFLEDANVEVRSTSVPGKSDTETTEANITGELLQQYEEEVGVLDEAMVRRMENEPDDDVDLPAEINEEFQQAMDGILPVKSCNRYLQAYSVFQKWQESYEISSFSEKVVMAYFIGASRKYKPPTLWSIYSMLKKTFLIKHNIDMRRYCRLRAFLKTKSDGWVTKKANVFTTDEVNKFIVEAPNGVYLAMKVVLIFGLNGTCRGGELADLTVNNVKDDGKELRVNIPNTKTKKSKEYIICDEFANIVREYIRLRPSNAKTNRLFLQWRNGKCVNQVMGKHSIAKIPKEVAKYLNLPEPSTFTGHSYRRTSTTVAADEGCTMDEIKRIGPWVSTKVAEQYVQDSLARKKKVAKMFSNAINLPSTSTVGVASADRTNRNNMEPVASLPELAIPIADDTVVDLNPATTSVASSSQFSGVGGAGSDKIDSRKILAPMSISVGSSSELTVSSGEKTLTISGSGKSVQTDGKENVIFHFAGECNNFTIIKMQ